MFNGDWEKAHTEYLTAKQFSVDPETQAAALLGLARYFLAIEDYSQTIDSLNELIQEYPQNLRLPHAYFLLGQAYEGLESFDLAAEAYHQYLTARPGVIDEYVLNFSGDALFSAGKYDLAANDYKEAIGPNSTLDQISIQLKLARSYALALDYQSALSLYDGIYSQTFNEYTRALIDLRKGQVYTELGQIDQANTAYLDAVQNYPQAYDSYSALVALIDAGVSVDELTRGIVDYYAGQYGVALSAFDRYLQSNPSDPATGYYYDGLTRLALGGYPDAIDQWDRVIEGYPDHQFWDDAFEEKAYTQWAFLEQYSEAVKTLLNFVDAAPTHIRAGDLLFQSARIAERGGDLSQAAELWERMANQYPGDNQAPDAIFLAGITCYRLEEYQKALDLFQRYLLVTTELGDRAKAHLWIGKSFQALGNTESARASWSVAAGTDPTGYYSERARDILDNREPFTPPEGYDLVVDLQSDRIKADNWLRNTFNLPAESNLSDLGPLAGETGILRGLELWELGQYTEARSEFEQLRQNINNDPELTYRLANFLINLGAYRSGIMAARQVLNLAGMDDASSLGAPDYFNHIRFGTYFSEFVMPLSQEYNFHPLFLFSVIRQESLFEGFVRSSANALGLMQIIPATGAEIAKSLGWPANYKEEDLLRPIVSLKFGVEYLNKQRDDFGGDLYTALAAYNGGPGNAAEWKKLAPDDLDLFLEAIRFNETRKYIQGIYEIFTLYRFIYNRTP
jgi:soluble lytic murein transglycosylase